MFRIELLLAKHKDLAGCTALDFQRKYGLEETGMVYCHYNRPHIYLEVPEDFARLYFDPDSLRSSIEIPLSFLKKGELALMGQYLAFSDTITPEMGMEMYVAGTVYALNKKLQEAEQELADLRAKIAECEKTNDDDIGED